ncbi:hypothetical protein ABFG93_21825 (plasmid) [Pseudalkalibacillus hwajinpoensis]|uniref:hypothetical protein n=1 Tax=Guptibacillus hwajinpoensis TaxID=208199 RepID=UPI00325B6E33
MLAAVFGLIGALIGGIVAYKATEKQLKEDRKTRTIERDINYRIAEMMVFVFLSEEIKHNLK